jgi:hypothetical protein
VPLRAHTGKDLLFLQCVLLSLGKYGRVVREADTNIHEEPTAFIFRVEDTVQENAQHYSQNDI